MPIQLPGINIEPDDTRRLLLWKLGLDPQTSAPVLTGDFQFVPYEAFDGLPDPAPDEVRLEDLYATVAMNSRAGSRPTWGLARVLRNDLQRQQLNELLGSIGRSADTATAGVETDAVTLLTTLIGLYGFGEAVTCKLLCRKRPNLFPMWDSLVAWYVDMVADSPLPAASPYKATTRARRLWSGIEWLSERVQENFADLERVADELTSAVGSIPGVPTPPVPITPLRVLESLIWLAMSPRWWSAAYWPIPYWSGNGLAYRDFGPEWEDFYRLHFGSGPPAEEEDADTE